MRRIFTSLHRALGLFLAAFLFVAGVTGAVSAWTHELDAMLNPEFLRVEESAREEFDALRIADDLEARTPNLQITYLPLSVERGSSLLLRVEPKPDASDTRKALGFDEMAVHPATGEVLGARQWGEVSLRRKGVMPFLYKLHYTLHLPGVYGTFFMGAVGAIWTFDCVVALVIAFPNPRVWWRSLSFRWRRGGIPLVFDLHRSGGVWVWLVLLMLAVTSVSMNLRRPVMRPLVAMVSDLTPNPYDEALPSTPPLSAPPLPRRAIVEVARAEALRRGWSAPPGALRYSATLHVYGVGFFSAGKEYASGLGSPWLYFDAASGSYRGERVPGEGSNGDLFLQSQFPLHSGRAFGTAGRIAMSTMGLVVASLSVTGILLWLNRRRPKTRVRDRRPT